MSDIKYFLVRYLWFLFPLKFFLFLFSPFPFSFYAVIRLAYFPNHPFPSGRGPLYCFMKLSQFPVCSTPPSFVLPPPPPPTNATYQHQYHLPPTPSPPTPPTNATYQHQYHHLPTPRTNTTNTTDTIITHQHRLSCPSTPHRHYRHFHHHYHHHQSHFPLSFRYSYLPFLTSVYCFFPIRQRGRRTSSGM